MASQSAFGRVPEQILATYPATALMAVHGANLGDPLSVADDLILGDAYQLSVGSKQVRLAIANTPGQDRLVVATETQVGLVGADLHLDCVATFMSNDGSLVEVIVVVELHLDRATIARVHAFPLAPMLPRRDYTLVEVRRDAAAVRFAEAACVLFTSGTQITMSNGQQVPVEDLRPGDSLLTRDHGPQKIRWVGSQTVRAAGEFAPIRIAKGVLNNARDLLVSPNHRLLVYQRKDRAFAGHSEILVKARNLLNGDTVTRTRGGFVDYFQLLFDRHEIIYAEGIAVETLLVDTRTRQALPHDIGARLTQHAVFASEFEHRGPVSVDMLRQSSAG